MSELIKKLYHQSVDETVELHKDKPHLIAWAWEEKFAKLIVEDILKNFEGPVPSRQYYYIADRIKKEYGIE